MGVAGVIDTSGIDTSKPYYVYGDKECAIVYPSIESLASEAARHTDDYPRGLRLEFHGVETWGEAFDLARDGWSERGPEAVQVAEDAISTVEQEHDTPTLSMQWDVSGSEVDIGRLSMGVPECMIDYALAPTPTHGRVITLAASISTSYTVPAETIVKRGHAVTALAFALTRLGYAVEIWADLSLTGNRGRVSRIRTLVKGTNDALDPDRVMFALAHPAMLRCLSLAALHELPARWRKDMRVGRSYGCPIDPDPDDYAEGSIILPCVSGYVPDADVALLDYLREVGIITD